MASSNRSEQMAREARRAIAGEDDPIVTVERELRKKKGGAPLLCVSREARDICGLTANTNARIHVFRDYIVVETGDQE